MGSFKDEMRKVKAALRKKAQEDSGCSAEGSETVEGASTKEKRAIDSRTTEPYPRPGPRQNRSGRRAAASQKRSKGARPKAKTPSRSFSSRDLEDAYRGTSPREKKRRYPEQLDRLEDADLSTFAAVRIARTADFKLPDSWVDAGRTAQPEGAGSGRVLPVRLGLDFGTAFTKVALRVAGKLMIVDWYGVSTSGDHHLLPCEMSEDGTGTLHLGRSEDAVRVHGALKHPFLNSQVPSMEQEACAVAFIALVLAYARSWLYHHQASLLAERRVAWNFNIGLPAEAWRDDTRYLCYQRVAGAAWTLSLSPGDLTLKAARDALNAYVAESELPGLDELGVVPEFAAQVATYANSPQGQYGLHFLVDVGAGTADQAIFSVHHRRSSGLGHATTLWGSRVRKLGTHYLMHWRRDRIPLCRDPELPASALGGSADALAAELGTDRTEIERVDEKFSSYFGLQLALALRAARSHGLSQEREWRSGMRVFLCGGGSALRAYERALQIASTKIGTPLSLSAFPEERAESTHPLPTGSFHRWSVAHGLTFDLDSIGDVFTDPPPLSRKPPRPRPDRDDLYEN